MIGSATVNLCTFPIQYISHYVVLQLSVKNAVIHKYLNPL